MNSIWNSAHVYSTAFFSSNSRSGPSNLRANVEELLNQTRCRKLYKSQSTGLVGSSKAMFMCTAFWLSQATVRRTYDPATRPRGKTGCLCWSGIDEVMERYGSKSEIEDVLLTSSDIFQVDLVQSPQNANICKPWCLCCVTGDLHTGSTWFLLNRKLNDSTECDHKWSRKSGKKDCVGSRKWSSIHLLKIACVTFEKSILQQVALSMASSPK